MTDWPAYVSHKIVGALPIVGIRPSNDPSLPPHLYVQREGNVGAELFEPNDDGMRRRAQVGDYAMLYPDGYKSVCPRKQFEEGYTRKP